MMPPTSIDGTDITGATIDGTDVTEITVDGDTVFTAVPVIPDSVVNNAYGFYDAGNLSLSNGNPVSTRPDQSGASNDLSGNGVFQASEVNGKDSVGYDGNNDRHTTSDSTTTPMTWFVVFRWDGSTTGASQQAIIGNGGGNTANRNYIGFVPASSEWAIRVGKSFATGGSIDTNWHVGAYKNDGSSGFMRIDGTEVLSASDGGFGDSESITIGDKQSNSDNRFSGSVPEAIFVNADVPQSDIEETEQSLADKYGITL